MPAKKKRPAVRRVKAKARKPAAKSKAKPVTSRSLLNDIAELLEQRGLDHDVILGCLCEVIAGHQPTAKRAVSSIAAMLDRAGIR